MLLTPVPTELVQAVVTDTDYATGTCTVLHANASTPVDEMPILGFMPAVGAVVWIAEFDDAQVVLGEMMRPNWRGPWGAPWGEVTDPVTPATYSGFTSENGIPGGSITWYAIQGRSYRIQAGPFAARSTVGGDRLSFKLYDNFGNVQRISRSSLFGSNIVTTFPAVWFDLHSILGGNLTWSLTAERETGSGTCDVTVHMMSVTDIGFWNNTP